ncbi:unnamed protein product [Cylicocyclus nassatus]|uniref:Uncharacterized protein n=1 Tax=Cylicocyclus nassatus TaxID=53992 RepID=A0AA36HBY4_CYLNA|nr:unnamed protein product [Cylicocyclus nassatus]
MDSLRRQLEEAQREAGQVAPLRRQLEQAKREANEAASLRKQLEMAEKKIDDLKAKMAKETRAANNYWSHLKRQRRHIELLTTMANQWMVDVDEGLSNPNL